ncbi:MAG: hypothetical protein ABIO55_11250 [Ginsengibacter sp.]
MITLKYFKNVTVICFLIISQQFGVSSALCQDNLNAISASLNQYHVNSIKEKIFVHTDKNFYVAGEIAWFKLYDVDASEHKPLELSKVAYVEIIDSANKPLLQAKIALHNSEGDGSFYLPFTLNSGNYKLRAYTRWMKNFDPGYFFEKDITIINLQKRLGVTATRSSNGFDIQFFPEGGNLVNNIPGKIAFKGTDKYGKGILFTGFLLDNTDTILKFKPTHAGMGSFVLTPLSNHEYKVFAQTASGEYDTKALPAAYSSGYVMNLSDSADSIRVMVQSDLSPQEVYLFVHTRENVKVASSSAMQNGKAVFVFDKKMLGDGISHLTVFNDKKQPVCERLYFKKPPKQLDLKISTDHLVYSVRNDVSFTAVAGSSDIKDDSASLSMTVYRLDSLQAINVADINTYLLLTSDLKGFIEGPNYYFLKDDDETNSALDNLLLTNGWRRFKWDDILKNENPLFNFVPEYYGQIIDGRVIDIKTGIPAGDIETFMSIPGFLPAFTSCVSDNDGRLKFELKNFYGSSEMIVQPNTRRDSIYRIEMTDPFSNSFSGTPLPLFSLQKSNSDNLLKQSIGMQVQNIYSGKKLRNFLLPVADSTPFYITPDAKYSLDNYTRFTTLEEVLREYVILVDVRKRDGRFHLNVFNLAAKQLFKNDPLVLLDGAPVFDLNKFMLLDPLKLNKLEVLNRKYFLGSSTFDGVLNWGSYKQDMAGYDQGLHAAIIDYDGLQLKREFYTPVYTDENQRSSHLPDFRNVLLWSPNIKIAPGESKTINFYTSDVTGKYAVHVQGITKNGLCGSKVLFFEVNK